MFRIQELKKYTKDISKKKQELEKVESTLISETWEKLNLYKECLLQRFKSDSEINLLQSNIRDIEILLEEFFKPLINAHNNNERCSFSDPGEF